MTLSLWCKINSELCIESLWPRVMMRRCFQLVVLCSLVISVLILWQSHQNPPLKEDNHVILVWTPIFGNWDWYPDGWGKKPFQNTLCYHDDCFLTRDRALLARADAVLFHCRDDILEWPESRSPRQLYGAACHESPSASNFNQYGDKLNLTMTYRRDSDIYFPNCWFNKKSVGSEHMKPYIPPVPLVEKVNSVVWPVSNCKASSKRERYVEELAKHIVIHIYGNCGPYKCPVQKSDGCLKQFRNNYKFYLSFENSVCKDYVTEKLFLPMMNDLIPIVFGGGDYTSFPVHSYINIRDFKTPRLLASYLEYLSNNETAYNEYFQWRTKYELLCENKQKLFCDLCAMLKSGSGKTKQYPDAGTWWDDGSTCHNDDINKILQV